MDSHELKLPCEVRMASQEGNRVKALFETQRLIDEENALHQPPKKIGLINDTDLVTCGICKYGISEGTGECSNNSRREIGFTMDISFNDESCDFFVEKNKSPFDEIPEFKSIDDIPLPQEDVIPPISFYGLPEFSYHKLFIDYIGSISDTYPEFSFQNATATLSTLVRKRLHFKLNSRMEYTNLITLCLGQSGYSRKSVPMIAAYNLLKEGIGDTFLSKDASPEGLISEMADIITTTRRTKDGNEDVVELKQKQPIRKALCSLWKDEAGQFYAQLNKPHMQSTKELLCHFYDCPTDYDKSLSSKKFHIGEIYFSMNLATTPTSFIQNVTTKDVHTGFLARHNIVLPTYQKIRKPLTEDTDDDLITEKAFQLMLKLLDKILPIKPLRMRINKAELEMLDNWCKVREEYFAKERNETMGSFFARFQINIIKIGCTY